MYIDYLSPFAGGHVTSKESWSISSRRKSNHWEISSGNLCSKGWHYLCFSIRNTISSSIFLILSLASNHHWSSRQFAILSILTVVKLLGKLVGFLGNDFFHPGITGIILQWELILRIPCLFLRKRDQHKQSAIFSVQWRSPSNMNQPWMGQCLIRFPTQLYLMSLLWKFGITN